MSDNRIANNDKVIRAEDRLNINPWDIEAWNVLLRDAQSKPIEESRPVFERIVKQFPLSGQYIKSFIAQEKKSNNFDNVENLFKEHLPKIYHIDLWKYYLSYIKEKDNKSTQFKERMAKAYEYAIEKMGLDLKSFSVWSDYIYFLKSTQVSSQYAESQKAIATRRTYQKALVTPMVGIETIWRDYNTFENSLNNIIGKRFIDEWSKDYMNARRVTKEYEVITKGLNRNLPSLPPQNTQEEIRQKDLWKKYINWEKNNPLNTDDLLTVTRRTLFAYEQCLLCLSHHPDIWYEAAVYIEQASKLLADKGDQENCKIFADKVSDMYQRATSLLSENLLLGFAYADYEESRSRFDKVETIYKSMIDNTKIDPTLVYIQYSRFVRRNKGIIGAREIFRLARNDSRTSYQIYVNAAMMEHYCSKEPLIAQRIFEYGLKNNMNVPEYVMAYVDYLDHLNEDNNTRVLFERALGTGNIPAGKSAMIWDRYLQFESFVGDLASILKVERRRLATALEAMNKVGNSSSAVGNVNNNSNSILASNNANYYKHQTALVIDRYRFGDLYPCTDSELKSLGYNQMMHKISANQIAAASSLDDVCGAVGNLGSAGLISDGGLPVLPLGGSSAVGAVGSSSGTGALLPGVAGGSSLAVIGSIGGGIRPDFGHMLPFKPRAFPRIGAHPVAGGEFPAPPSCSHANSSIPPPSCFHGPFVNVNPFMEHYLETVMPEEFANPPLNDAMLVDNGTALTIESMNTNTSSGSAVVGGAGSGLVVNSNTIAGGMTVNSVAIPGRKRLRSSTDNNLVAVSGLGTPGGDSIDDGMVDQSQAFSGAQFFKLRNHKRLMLAQSQLGSGNVVPNNVGLAAIGGASMDMMSNVTPIHDNSTP